MKKIPEVTDLDIAFGNIKHLPWHSSLPEEFFGPEGWPYFRAFKAWFFRGATEIENGIVIDGVTFLAKPGVDSKKAIRAIRACMVSWAPKHERKEAGCAFMLSEWFEKQ